MHVLDTLNAISAALGLALGLAMILTAVVVARSSAIKEVRLARQEAAEANRQATDAWQLRADCLDKDLSDTRQELVSAQRDIASLKTDAAQRDVTHALALKHKDKRIADLELTLAQAEQALVAAQARHDVSIGALEDRINALRRELARLDPGNPLAQP